MLDFDLHDLYANTDRAPLDSVPGLCAGAGSLVECGSYEISGDGFSAVGDDGH